MRFEIRYTDKANRDLVKLHQCEPKAFQEALILLDELAVHPRTGTGKPEQLSGNRAGQWSRRITKKHRLIYEIRDAEILVLVLTAYSHYGDK